MLAARGGYRAYFVLFVLDSVSMCFKNLYMSLIASVNLEKKLLSVGSAASLPAGWVQFGLTALIRRGVGFYQRFASSLICLAVARPSTLNVS